MRLISICSIILFLTLTSCKEKFETVEKFNENGQLSESFTIDKETKLIEGIYQKYYENGNVEERAEYTNNKLHGSRTLFYKNGDVQIVESHQDGRYVGDYKSYFKGGVLESEGVYTDGMMGGEWKFYYDNKQLKEAVHFENNEENGAFVEYYKNGNLKAKGTYKTSEENIDSNKEHGPLELYDEKGVLMKKMNCAFGICKTTWKRDDT